MIRDIQAKLASRSEGSGISDPDTGPAEMMWDFQPGLGAGPEGSGISKVKPLGKCIFYSILTHNDQFGPFLPQFEQFGLIIIKLSKSKFFHAIKMH